MLSPEIIEYYNRGGELDRLAAGAGRLEFLRTWDLLTRILPPAPARVVDVGGATGVYAGPLAAVGYTVHVVDPVPSHVAASAALAGVTAAVGDARNLPEEPASADAVLLLGPLYHLPDRTDRVQAWREAVRVTRPGGVVAGAVISRFASMLDGFARGFFAEPGYRDIVEADLAGGVHRNPVGHPRWFTDAYFHRPEEAPVEALDAGLVDVQTAAIEGPIAMIGPRLDDFLADADLTQIMMDMLRRVEQEPTFIGSSSHLLVTAHHPPR
jgi:SAM-dependent methyltransferase